MDINTALKYVKEFLDIEMFEIAGTRATVATLLTILVIIVATFWISRLVRRGVEVWFNGRGVNTAGSVHAIGRLIHYVVVFTGFGIALQTLGISLGALFAAGAMFAVGLGFAMQNIAQNFVSGVILLAERAIKPGDVLRVEGEVVRVGRLGIRSTMVQTRDGLDLIVPNSVLVQSTVANYTLNDLGCRVRVMVGVSYGSDLELVSRVLKKVAHDFAKIWANGGREHQVLLAEFGSSSVDFEVAVWIEDPWRERLAMSDLRDSIWQVLKEHGVVIAFPQLDVHFDAPVQDGLARYSIGA